jgi:hypothetical protein
MNGRDAIATSRCMTKKRPITLLVSSVHPHLGVAIIDGSESTHRLRAKCALTPAIENG